MKRVTRNIDLTGMRDLLERVPRACISFACDHGPQAQPIMFVWHDGRYLAGLPEEADRWPSPEQEVVLLIDEGVHYFELRAVYVRGKLTPAKPPQHAPANRMWFEVVPLKTVAWDYGRFREVQDES